MFNLGAFLSYVFVVTFTPGPNNIMSMANASKYGYKKTLKFILGVSTGFFVIMLLCSYFNLLLFNLMPKVKTFMGIIGAGYMIYLAVKIMQSKEKVVTPSDTYETSDEGKEQTSSKGKDELNLFFTGMIMQFVNPKVILYGITVISNFITPFYKSNTLLILFSFFLASVGFWSTSCWSLFGSLFNKFLSKYEKQFNIVMGLLLIYSALSILGITHLFNK
ncbi:lysine transporter LysE [Alkaliphilus pronyensis]|uniref:Lysine transporter LysE n=1 Tax=Alkaliphilus pronyensis TaxID=1482732 RepID=A0A6I0FQD0_9FIRM|nr:LysE family transporter [Alkaliphilus pronyensis]KAB3538534.1 lysine transporter LysE [Alkaliphilus pronyensis]